MWRVFGGAIMVIAGIAAFIEAHGHKPQLVYAGNTRDEVIREVQAGAQQVHIGLSQTAYDLLRIGAWALAIFGGLLVVVGLIAQAKR
jgi:hypothetical protein